MLPRVFSYSRLQVLIICKDIDSFNGYSPCGNYVLAATSDSRGSHHDMICWEIPERVRPSSLVIPKVIHPLSPSTDGAFDVLSKEIFRMTGDQTFKINGDFEGKSVQRLTPLPSYLDKAHIIFILGDGENPDIKMLFLRHDALPEMRCLGMRLNEYREKLERLRDTLTKGQEGN